MAKLRGAGVSEASKVDKSALSAYPRIEPKRVAPKVKPVFSPRSVDAMQVN